VDGKELSDENFTLTEKNKLANQSGTNTGDQDLSSYATNTSVDDKILIETNDRIAADAEIINNSQKPQNQPILITYDGSTNNFALDYLPTSMQGGVTLGPLPLTYEIDYIFEESSITTINTSLLNTGTDYILNVPYFSAGDGVISGAYASEAYVDTAVYRASSTSFMGIAVASTNPGTPSTKVWYRAVPGTTYTYFLD